MVLKIYFGQIVIFMTDLEEIILKTCKLNPCDVKFSYGFLFHGIGAATQHYMILTF